MHRAHQILNHIILPQTIEQNERVKYNNTSNSIDTTLPSSPPLSLYQGARLVQKAICLTGAGSTMNR